MMTNYFLATGLLLALGWIVWLHRRCSVLIGDVRYLHASTKAQFEQSERRVKSLEEQLRQRSGSGGAVVRFHAQLSIGETLKLHPGAKAVFAVMNISGCGTCSTGGRESLAEACAAHGIDLADLLQRLNQLPPAEELAAAARIAEPEQAVPQDQQNGGLPPTDGGRMLIAVRQPLDRNATAE
jgi:hypothetical protein